MGSTGDCPGGATVFVGPKGVMSPAEVRAGGCGWHLWAAEGQGKRHRQGDTGEGDTAFKQTARWNRQEGSGLRPHGIFRSGLHPCKVSAWGLQQCCCLHAAPARSWDRALLSQISRAPLSCWGISGGLAGPAAG